MKKIIFVLLLVFFCSMVSAQPTDLVDTSKVLINYQGSWQWLANEHQTYTFTQEPTRNVLYWETFSLDLDDAEERNLIITYLNHSYSISAQKSPSGGTDVIFTASKDNTHCGRVVKTLNRTSNIVINDFVSKCGLGFSANWDTLAFETDVQIEDIYFTSGEIRKNLAEAVKYIQDHSLEDLVKATKASNAKFRVIELRDPNHFSPNQKGAFKTYAVPLSIDEEASGKENGFVVTNNGKILYVLFMKKQFTNEFYVAKPTVEKKSSDYSSWDLLKQDIIINPDWQEISKTKLGDAEQIESYIQNSIGIAAIAGAPTAAAYAIGAGSFAVWGTGAAIDSALATAAATSAIAPGVTGGTLLGSGSLTAISLTPVGWVLIGAAVIGGSGYAVYHFTDSDTYGYEGLILNVDPELISFYEAKVNFMSIRDPEYSYSSAPASSAVATGKVLKIGFEDLPEILLAQFTEAGYLTGDVREATIKVYEETNPSNILKVELVGFEYIIHGAEVGKIYMFELKLNKGIRSDIVKLRLSNINDTDLEAI